MDDDDESSPWDHFSGIIAESIGIDDKNIDLQKAYSNIGGSSLNAVAAVLSLKLAGYNISIEQFLEAKSLGDLLEKDLGIHYSSDKFVAKALKEADANEARTLVVRCFLRNSEFLVMYHYDNEEEFKSLLATIWEFLLPYSLAVFDQNGILRGVALALDEFDGAKATMERIIESEFKSSYIAKVFAFLDYLTHPVEEELNPEHQPRVIFMKFMLAVANDLNTPEENVSIFYLMERELKTLAENNGFEWTLAQNVSPVTQGLTQYIGCKTFSKTFIKRWTDADGTQPFAATPDDFTVTIDGVQLHKNS